MGSWDIELRVEMPSGTVVAYRVEYPSPTYMDETRLQWVIDNLGKAVVPYAKQEF